MTIDELKELERKHGSGWRFQDNTNDKSVSGEVVFLNTFLGLREELLALWESVKKQQSAPEGRKCHSTTLCEAFDALEKKAASMDA